MYLRRIAIHVVPLATVAFFLGMSAWVIYQVGVPISPVERKIIAAERISYHVVRHESGPEFELAGTETVLKLISHAVLDGIEQYDPRRTTSYRLILELHHGERRIWHHEAQIDSRQSKFDLRENVWLEENAFTSRMDMELTDDRVLIVHLPADIPMEASLHIRLAGEPQKALVRVYQRVARTEEQRRRRARLLETAEADHLVGRSTYAPWALLSDTEQMQRLSHRFVRMAPAGEAGVDFHNQSIWYTGFRLSLDELKAKEGLLLERHRAIALNVIGPTRLRFELEGLPPPPPPDIEGENDDESEGENDDDNQQRGSAIGPASSSDGRDVGRQNAAAGEAGNQIEMMAVTTTGRRPVWRWQVPEPGVRISRRLELPPGLHSLRLYSNADHPVRIDVSGPPMSQFGALPYVARGEGMRRLIADERRMVVYATGEHAPPVQAGIFFPDDAVTRILRVDIRLQVPEPPWARARQMYASTVEIAFVDQEGQTITVEQHQIEVPYAPFERLERPHSEPIGVTEAIGIRLVVPDGTALVQIRSEHDAAVRIYRFLSGSEAYQAPYRDLALEGQRWRYAPRDRRQWFHAAPANALELLNAEQRMELVAQVRLDPAPERKVARPRTRRGARHSAALTPQGQPERHAILDPVPRAQTMDIAGRWPSGTVTQVEPGRPLRLRFAAPTRPRLRYAVGENQLGRGFSIALDGTARLRGQFGVTRGTISLPRIEPGIYELALNIESDDVGAGIGRRADPSRPSFTIDRPPADISPATAAANQLWRTRTVYALTASKGIELAVRKPAADTVYVHVVAYAADPAASEDTVIRAVIGGGRPDRVRGVALDRITVAERDMSLPAATHRRAAVFAERSHESVGYARTLTIPLGRDLVAGTHRIGFSLRAGQKRLWLRFFATVKPAAPEERMLQWRFDAPWVPESEELGTLMTPGKSSAARAAVLAPIDGASKGRRSNEHSRSRIRGGGGK